MLSRDQIQEALENTQTVTEAAELLGVDRTTLYRRMKAENIAPKYVGKGSHRGKHKIRGLPAHRGNWQGLEG